VPENSLDVNASCEVYAQSPLSTAQYRLLQARDSCRRFSVFVMAVLVTAIHVFPAAEKDVDPSRGADAARLPDPKHISLVTSAGKCKGANQAGP
jgi:hypothetical protein